MNKVARIIVLGLTLAMAGAFLPARSQPAEAAVLACPQPEVCYSIIIDSYCNCLDLNEQQVAQCIADTTDELCGGGADACGLDDRVNTNCSAPEILYCNGDLAEFYEYNFSTGEGEFDFSIPLADLMKSVEVKTLLKQVGQVKIYLLPDGTVELLAPQPDGKIYFMVFDPAVCVSLQEGAEWGLK